MVKWSALPDYQSDCQKAQNATYPSIRSGNSCMETCCIEDNQVRRVLNGFHYFHACFFFWGGREGGCPTTVQCKGIRAVWRREGKTHTQRFFFIGQQWKMIRKLVILTKMFPGKFSHKKCSFFNWRKHIYFQVLTLEVIVIVKFFIFF